MVNPNTDFNMKNFFESYSMVYKETKNNMEHRRIHSIALRESNKDEGHFFMSLYTEKDIHNNYWM